MSESQSRYSIVERLTRQKLQILEEKSILKSKAEEKKRKAQAYQSDAEEYERMRKQEIEANYKSNLASYEVQVADKKAHAKQRMEEAEMYEKSIPELLNSAEERIKVIDNALDKLEEISKAQA